ncbi:terminase small subunit [Aurantimonas litoralis]|nr:terminase small subunit [Aurantimonas litoralis]
MALGEKRGRFVEEYLHDLNATQAAIRAGYSQKTAYSQGQRLLKDVEVSAAIAGAKTARSARTRVDADWLLRRLADEAEADVADLYDENGSLRSVQDWPPIWRKGLVAGLDVEEVKEEGVTVGVIRKLKLSDRVKRLELIGKHVEVQAFKDQVETSGNVTVNIAGPDADL